MFDACNMVLPVGFVVLFWPPGAACRILSFSDQGINPFPLQWKLGVLTTGLSGKSLAVGF